MRARISTLSYRSTVNLLNHLLPRRLLVQIVGPNIAIQFYSKITISQCGN